MFICGGGRTFHVRKFPPKFFQKSPPPKFFTRYLKNSINKYSLFNVLMKLAKSQMGNPWNSLGNSQKFPEFPGIPNKNIGLKTG